MRQAGPGQLCRPAFSSTALPHRRFPGFIVFAHAWNGFLYEATLTTQVSVARPASADNPAQTRAIETKYDMRFCDFDRGAATSSGWYTPGWGGLNLLIGGFMVPYDSDATPAFQEQVQQVYGRYIASNIVEMAHEELEGQGTHAGSSPALEGAQPGR